MKKTITIICLTLVLMLFSGCVKNSGEAVETAELPEPSGIYAAITETANLTEMVESPLDTFPYLYGINLDWFDSAVAYTSTDTRFPDEIVIIKAIDTETADKIVEKLNARLAYKLKVSANYLPETASVIRDGVIRRDGLTVSLLVTSELDVIVDLYKTMQIKS